MVAREIVGGEEEATRPPAWSPMQVRLVVGRGAGEEDGGGVGGAPGGRMVTQRLSCSG